MTKAWTRDAILAIGRQYHASVVLVAAAELNVFDELAGQSLSASELAHRLDADPRGTKTLLDALAALELLDKSDGRYVLPLGLDQILTQEGNQSVVAMLRHQANCLRRWVQLAEVVRSGQPARRRPSIRGEEADEAAFIGAMQDVCAPVADDLILEIGPSEFRHLLDVGGASGTWTIAFLKHNPGATATLFDLPHVIPMAERRLSAAGMADRVTLVGGDFSADPLPTGADLAWVSAIMHQNSREQNRHLFAAIAKALVGPGRILIRDVLMDESRTGPTHGALFAINMLVATEAGGTYTFDEIREDLETAGFVGAEVLRRDEGMNSVIRAGKP